MRIPWLLWPVLPFLFALTSCGGDAECSGGVCKPMPVTSCRMPTGTAYKSVANRVVFGTQIAPCAIDQDGDGKLDNALVGIVAAIKATFFDLQRYTDDTVRNGDMNVLTRLQTESLEESTCAGFTLQRGFSSPPPRFDGTDVFTYNSAAPLIKVLGHIAGGVFESPLPTAQTEDTLVRAEVALIPGFGFELELPLSGVHVRGQVAQKGLSRMSLHGVVPKEQIAARIYPGLAQFITRFIQEDIGHPGAQELIRRFETSRKCTAYPERCCGKGDPRRCEITAEEVAGYPPVQLGFTPDVQMFDEGRWSPGTGGPADSLSIGFCLDMVPARF